MTPQMFGTRWYQFQILITVVRAVAVNVMHIFFGQERSTDDSFHNYAMLAAIALPLRDPKIDVSVCAYLVVSALAIKEMFAP